MNNVVSIKKILFIFVCYLFFVILSSNIYAQSYITDYIDLNEEAAFETSQFMLKSEHNVYNSGDVSRLDISVKQKNDDKYGCHYIIYYYDENNEEIGKNYGNDIIWASTKSINSDIILQNIDDSSLYDGKKVLDIKKYKIFIESESEEVVQKVLDGETTAFDIPKDNNAVLMGKIAVFDYDKTELPYYIDSYNITMIVNEDNTFDIAETITTYFNESRHGIFRKIPVKNIVERLDGTSSKNIAKISDINVNEKFSKYIEDDYRIIKIGDADEYITGEKEYNINYRYNIGKDPLKDSDELYFNLIGNEWDTSINNVTFTIQMPKEFDTSKLGFAAGYSGSTNTEDIEYEVKGNVITGKYNKVLTSGKGITVRLELPEGYFVGASLNLDWFLILAFILPVLFAISIVVIWIKKGKDDIVIETVEFYPPEGYNSAEVGFMYKGRIDNQAVISLLIELANKGYIKIIEQEKDDGKDSTFKIVKVKEYDGTNVNEKTFFDGLFEKSTVDIDALKNIKSFKDMLGKTQDDFIKTTKLEEATEDDLTDSFFVTIDKIKENINSKENKLKLFEKGLTRRTIIGILMMLISFILTTSVILYGKGEEGDLFAAIFIPCVLGIMSYGAITATKSIIITIIMLGFDFAGVVGVSKLLFPVFYAEPIYILLYVLTIICVGIIAIFTKLMPKRTKFGIAMLGKIGGFKNFLEIAKKEELEALVEKNPEYFYDVLPYTYALGVSDKWIKKFETISIKPATWCESYNMMNGFDMKRFGNFMEKTMESASASMSSRPSSDSGSSGGGGFSGGGSSGGGSGGGGGGSW